MRRILRAEHNFVNFTLARREFTVRRERARDVGVVAAVFAGDVNDDDIAVLDFVVKRIVVQNR